jgi:copper homeostasis protein (lipoprotein)
MQHLRHFWILVLLFGIAACKQKPAKSPIISDSITAAVGEGENKWVNYTGTLPCVDCDGVETILSLYQPAGKNGDYQFKLQETYKGIQEGKDVTLHSEGAYGVVHKNAAAQDMTIIQLNPEKDKALQRYFERISEHELRMLDKDGKPIAGRQPHSLVHNE